LPQAKATRHRFQRACPGLTAWRALKPPHKIDLVFLTEELSMGTHSSAESAQLLATLNMQRKAAIAKGGAFDFAGQVQIERMPDFDLDRTIFSELAGIGRKFMSDRLSKEAVWDRAAAADIEAAYAQAQTAQPIPPIDPRLIQFMVDECDFSMEHADGTFLEHLVFCHHYAARHYPGYSPNVALLHSILGTSTNVFAMKPEKLPKLKALLTEFEAIHVDAFPSVYRLLNTGLMEDLEQNAHRLGKLKTLHYHRVIDNEPLSIDATNFWIQLNYHLIHLVDFVPTANWSLHRADLFLQIFERLSQVLNRAGQRQAQVEFSLPKDKIAAVGETVTLFGRISRLLLSPAANLALTRKTIRQYSAKCGHDLSYRLEWAD
jgi:hypothetical protein